MADEQRKMYLPLLEELSITDVVKLRQLDEWQDFSESQKEILKNPLDIHNRLEIFQYKFEKFQNAMSNWFYKEYPAGKKKTKARAARHANYVTVALQAGGQLIVLGIDPRFDQKRLKGSAALYEPERLKDIKIKDCDLLLLFNVINMDTGRLDENRSYSIELVRDDQDFKGLKVIELTKSFEDISGDKVDYSDASRLAEQGK